MTVTPGTPNNGSNITPSFTPVNGGDYVPLPNHPQGPFDNTDTLGNHASSPTPANNTLVYSPDVRIVIAHTMGPVSKQYDISNDIVRGTLIRKENAASTLIWQCHNKNLRYTSTLINNTPLFARMDRVVCYMKRAGTWIQVFSGYLDSIPYLQLFPGIVQFKATCTLKRLLDYWWNPGLPDSMTLLNQFATASQATQGDGQAQNNQAAGGSKRYADTGLASMLSALLTQVGHWDPTTVHIQNFPSGFMDLLQSQMKEQSKQQQAGEWFRQLLEGNVSGPAPGAAAGYNSGAGAPGPSTPGVPGGPGAPGATTTGSQGFYVQEIVAACDSLGMGPSTSNLNLSTGVQQAAVSGEGSRDQATQAAFQQTQTAAKNYQTSTLKQDAAILGVATAIVESGLHNYANPGNAESQNIPSDGNPPGGGNGTSVGLFQQIDTGWGTTAQRMNPRQSATMFFQRLQGYDWKNLDPGVACWDVQRAGDQSGYEAKIDAAVPQATQLVQSYRNASASPGSSTVSTATGSVPVQQATALANPLGNSGVGATNNPTASPNVILTSGGTPGSGPGIGGNAPTVGGATGTRPNPDSEGAIAFAAAQIGKPYIWGGTGPNGYDCSGLLQAAFQSIGVAIGRNTTAQAGSGQRIAPQNIQRGDALQCESGQHTMLWLGDGTIIEASTEGVPIHRVPAYVQPAAASGIFRYCANGGAIPGVGGAITGAPYNNPQVSGPGNPPSIALASQGQVGGGPGSSAGEPIAQNLFAYLFQPETFISDTAFMFSGATPQKDFINAQPLIQAVQSICGASLRNFASAPNGDFIAYYPDFFGMDGKPAVFLLEDVELKDLTLNFSDDSLATHVYVNGDLTMIGEMDATMGWLLTMGYATVENEELYARMRRVSPGDLENMTGKALMRRFGVRPVQVTYAMAGTGELEFLLSVRLFMEKWAAQYQSSMGMTFMPDLFPGMRVVCTNHNLQFYVQEVTHSFDFEQGFSSDAVVTAPSNPNVRNLWSAANTNVPTVTGQNPTTVTV